MFCFFFFSSRRRHTRCSRDWSSDVCSSDLYQDDEYGKSILAALEKDLGRHGLKLVATESVKRGVTDVSAQMAKLQAARPDVLFLVLTPGPGAQALRERQKIGWIEVVMVSSGPLTDERYL